MRVTHRMEWGTTAAGKRFAACSCGWRAPARKKLTHGMSDVRDHLAAVKAAQKAAGREWWMVAGAGLVTDEPEPHEELGALPEVVEDRRVGGTSSGGRA
jgi:hypothetical protein